MEQGQQVDPQDVIQALSFRLANLEIEIAARDALISKMMRERDGQQDTAPATGAG